MAPYLVIVAAAVIFIGLMVVLMLRPKKDTVRDGKVSVLASSLRDEKLKSDVILRSIDDGVLLVDIQGTIQLFNPAAGRITGWDPKEAAGISYKSVMQLQNSKGEAYDQLKDPFSRAFNEKKAISDHEASLQARSGSSISLDITISPLMDQDQDVVGAVAVFRDVSEQRKEEQQRADFISTASHEMRTPVAAIEGYLALAMNDKVVKIDDKARSFLEKAHDSTKHLGKLFQDLLTSAKAEDGRLTNHPQIVEMGEFMSSLAESLRFTAENKGLGLEFVLGAEDSIVDASSTAVIKPLYYVNVDPDRLREVVTNLFDNAVKYTDSGKISLGLTGDKDVVQIRVRDTGPGIPAEDLPHLFQKFYRVDNSVTRTIGGTGLGLFICRKIVELYNGRIWVDSELGKGSTFYINLPRVAAEQAKATQQQESVQLPQITTPDTNL